MNKIFTLLFLIVLWFGAGDQLNAQCVPDPPLDLGTNIIMCTGDSTSLSVSSMYADINWSTGDTTSTIPITAGGTYWVAIEDSSGCTASDTLLVVENQVPVVELIDSLNGGAVVGDELELCVGDSVDLFAPAGYAAYLWQDSLSGDPTTDRDFLLVATAADSAGFTYGVKVRNQSQFSQCAAFDSVLIRVYDPPVVNLMPQDTAFCGPGSVTLSAPAGLVSYSWSTGDTTESIDVTADGSYFVTVEGAGGCIANSDTSMVTVLPSPAVPTILKPNPQQFLADPLLSGASYQWFLDSLPITGGENGVLDHDSIAGVYYVEVTSANGCPAAAPSDTVQYPEIIPVTLFQQEFIPQLITPNGDTKNDGLEIENIHLWPENELTITNRWGQTVFKTIGYDNVSNVFEGLAENGEPLPDGTYYYILQLFDNDPQFFKGYIVISR